MPDVQLDGTLWVAETDLKSWQGFQGRCGAYGGLSLTAPSDGRVRIVFAPEGRDDSPLTQDELALVQWR